MSIKLYMEGQPEEERILPVTHRQPYNYGEYVTESMPICLKCNIKNNKYIPIL